MKDPNQAYRCNNIICINILILHSVWVSSDYITSPAPTPFLYINKGGGGGGGGGVKAGGKAKVPRRQNL